MRIITAKLSIVILSVVVCLIIAALIRSCWEDKTVQASVSATHIRLGESINLVDSTDGAFTWLWELGNGDTLTEQKTTYTFTETGKYQIRLLVNNSMSAKFLVDVSPAEREGTKENNKLVKISAPDMAIQGEYVIFKGEGESDEWRWEFGESGQIDSRERNAVYAYSEPGTYEVLLSTEDTKYPVRHIIQVFSHYVDNDTIDVLDAIGEDIRLKLQAMADGDPFSENYHYVLDNYLCSDPDAIVVINNSLYNDFYSYCQGLKIIGLNKTQIVRVVVSINPNEDQCINKLSITQYEHEK